MQKFTYLILLIVPFLVLPLSPTFAQAARGTNYGPQNNGLRPRVTPEGDDEATAFKGTHSDAAYARVKQEGNDEKAKVPFRDEDGSVKYAQYNRRTKEYTISDSAGAVVGFLVKVTPAKIFVLNSKRVFMGYILRKGKSFRKYNALGQLVKKEKARDEGGQNLYACLAAN
jgi:hypothetical protein